LDFAGTSQRSNDQRGAARPKVSVVVPLYNEQECIRPLHAAIVQSLAQLGCTFEMIFVDDGSTDHTAAVATEVARNDSRLCIVRFRRNYGQTAAMAAGIEHARGETIVTMDGDLQNDPNDIRRLLEKLDQGYDIVVGWRFKRQDKLVSRKIPSRIANWLIGRVTGVPIRDNGCSLKAYRASLIKQIPLYSEMHRFIPAMASIAGPRIAEIKVRHHARQFGESKYGLSRTYKVLLDLLMVKTVASFTSRPLLWFSMLATPLAVIGGAALARSLWVWATSPGPLPLPVAGAGVILLFSAFMLFCGGAVGELVYKLGDMREADFSHLTQRVWGVTGET
jgi:glycosyltransferase involved in cell wall biosynthesis